MAVYGVPYQGGKTGIAERIVEALPAGGVLADLFCGGCAITHAALLSGKWGRVVANDLDGRGLRLFLGGMRGEYRGRQRLVTREEFHAEKNEDEEAALLWSFGSKMEHYLWSRDYNEDIKQTAFRLIVSDNQDERHEAYLGLARQIKELVEQIRRDDRNKGDWKKEAEEWAKKAELPPNLKEKNRLSWERGMRRTALMKPLVDYLCGAFEASGLTMKQVNDHLGNGMGGHYFTRCSQWALPTPENYAKLREIIPALDKDFDELAGVSGEGAGVCGAGYEALRAQYDWLTCGCTAAERCLDSINRIDAVTRMNRVRALEGLPADKVEAHFKDYREVDIPEGAVVYCDIPYRGTTQYGGVGDFDHEAFYEWAKSRPFPVYISEYNMPDDFYRIRAWSKQNTLAGGRHSKAVTEGLYCTRNEIGGQKLMFAV